MDESLVIETPEQLELRFRVARLGSRFVAAAWDSFFLGVTLLLFTVGALLARDALGSLSTWVGESLFALVPLVSFGLTWGYYVGFEVLWNGQTPGKRLAGIRVLRQDGYPIGLSESAIRNLVRVVDFLPAAYTLGTLVMFWDGQARRLGDFAAGTLVLHVERAAPPAVSVAPSGALMEPAIPNLYRLDERTVAAVRSALQRSTLANRAVLEAALAARVRQHLAWDDPTLSDHTLLQRVVAQHGQGMEAARDG